MLFLYLIGILTFAGFFFCTFSYRKKLQKKLNKKTHKLQILYGMAMFLTDRLPQRQICQNKKINTAMKELYVKEDVEKEKYLYIVQKVSICLMIIWVTLLIGFCVSLSEKISGTQYIKALQRDTSKPVTYEFVAQNEKGEEETLVVDVNKKEITVDESYQLFEKYKKTLIQKVLGENKSVNYVDSPLTFVNSIGEEGVDISWSISDNKILGYDGDIGKDVPKEGVIVNLTATMSLNDVSMDYIFAVKVFPKKEDASLQNKIQKYIDENNKYEKEVKLPARINGQQMKYYEKSSTSSKGIILLGIFLAIALFFLKDWDVKKAVEERNNQMLRDYSEIVSKILLYYEAGLSIKSGFEKIVEEYKKEKTTNKKLFRYAYEELEMALNKMKSGVSDITAVKEYGKRCGLHCYIKLASIMEQNLKRGSKELTYALQNEVDRALNERKNQALKEGEKISTKLLGPMVLMLIISIALIIVPATMSMNF